VYVGAMSSAPEGRRVGNGREERKGKKRESEKEPRGGVLDACISDLLTSRLEVCI